MNFKPCRDALRIRLLCDSDKGIYCVAPVGCEPGSNDCTYYLHYDPASYHFEKLVFGLISFYAEDGKVGYIENGRDCDCVEYSGRTHLVNSSLDAYYELMDNLLDSNDGPFELEVCQPSLLKRIKYESRDLVMEAREDGGSGAIVRSRFA